MNDQTSLVVFEKQPFESAFDSLVKEYINNGTIEKSAKEYFLERIKEGKLINYIIDKKVPLDIVTYISIEDLVQNTKEVLDNTLKDNLSKKDITSLLNIGSNFLINACDKFLGNKNFEYNVSFNERVNNLIDEYTIEGDLTNSASRFFEKYWKSSSNNKYASPEETKMDIFEAYKKKVHRFLKQFLDDTFK